MAKRILFLGGSNFQLAPILYAKSRSYHVFTCDYLPQNPGHRYADAYYNISTTDYEAVLKLARDLAIDGIVAYASDPAAPVAAFVANELQLPGNPFDSVNILTRKDLFREFLRANNFNAPFSKSFSQLDEAWNFFEGRQSPMMIKPVDSSGSKGVSKVFDETDFRAAFERALVYSKIKRVIVEEFIERNVPQIAGDGFMAKGKLTFRCFGQEHFNDRCNPFVPVGESFPLLIPESIQNKIHDEVQRLLAILNMKTGGLNFDIIIDNNQKIYLMEIGPRCGGNLIPDVIKLATGVDLAEYVVEAAIGNEIVCENRIASIKNYASYMIHAEHEGIFSGLYLSNEIKDNIVMKQTFIEKGSKVNRFDGSNHTLGCIIFKFESSQEMINKMNQMNEFVRVMVN